MPGSSREKVKGVLQPVKDYYLFARGAEAKTESLAALVNLSQELMLVSEEFVSSGVAAATKVVKRGVQKLEGVIDFTKKLFPQIKSWMETGVVAPEKLLHSGITQARSIVTKKAGKKTEFGLKWLLNRIGGGSGFGQVVAARADERKMPLAALHQSREVFGEQSTPLLSVYDRGGSHAATEKKLKKAGVAKVAIQPQGKAAWSVVEADQKVAISHRGKTEGVRGTLKSKRYDFNGGRQRTNETLKAAGQRSMFGMNLTNLLRDLVRKEKTLTLLKV